MKKRKGFCNSPPSDKKPSIDISEVPEIPKTGEKSAENFLHTKIIEDNYTDEDLKDLQGWWTAVLGQYVSKAVNTSIDEGPGVSIFRILRNNNVVFNANYTYVNQDGQLWKNILESLPPHISTNIINKYNHREYFLILLEIPRKSHDNQYISSIRMFRFSDHSEITT